MKVTIKATEAVRRYAQKALEIQDAINPYAVGTFLQEVQSHFRQGPTAPPNGQEYTGGEMGIQNPVSLAILNKLNSLARLARLEQSGIKWYLACDDLAKGNDVKWEIDLY